MRRLVVEFKFREDKEMKKLIVVMGLVALLVMGTTYVLAKGPGGPGPGRMADENWGCQKGVSLTPDQRTKLQELRRKLNEETAQLREAIRAKSQELRSLWTNPTADSKVIMEKEKELRTLRDQIRDKAVEMRLEARTILTPEQLEQTGKGRGAGPASGRGYKMGGGRGAGRCGACW